MPAGRSSVVLFVQQPNDDVRMYAEFFAHHRIETVIVSTAADALTAAPNVDAIVTELLIDGDTTGLELIAELKASPSTAAKPIIVLTASAWAAQRDQATAAGCTVFLAKPCLPDVLLREARRVIGHRAVQR